MIVLYFKMFEKYAYDVLKKSDFWKQKKGLSFRNEF